MLNKNINLVLQGGGIKGLAYIGALRYLEENNININYIAGSSVGAIIGSLIACGYDSYELEDIINNISINTLIKELSTKEKIKNKGLYSIKNLEEYLEKLLLKKNKRVFSDIKIGNNYKAIFMTTSLKHKRIFVLPYDLKYININPDTFPIAKAAAMSASLPFFYEPYRLNKQLFLDGGISDNYPKWCFSEALALKVSNENYIFKKIKNNIFGSINNPNKLYEVYIDTKEYKSTDFLKGLNNKYDLYNRGYVTLMKCLDKNNLI